MPVSPEPEAAPKRVSPELGAALKRWRVAARLNQTDVATAAEVSQSTISASESGTFSAGVLLKLIDIYKPAPEDLAAVMTAAADGCALDAPAGA
jgi:transcriptional regulator with XRE-family HTH domain